MSWLPPSSSTLRHSNHLTTRPPVVATDAPRPRQRPAPVKAVPDGSMPRCCGTGTAGSSPPTAPTRRRAPPLSGTIGCHDHTSLASGVVRQVAGMLQGSRPLAPTVGGVATGVRPRPSAGRGRDAKGSAERVGLPRLPPRPFSPGAAPCVPRRARHPPAHGVPPPRTPVLWHTPARRAPPRPSRAVRRPPSQRASPPRRRSRSNAPLAHGYRRARAALRAPSPPLPCACRPTDTGWLAWQTPRSPPLCQSAGSRSV